ncbi:tRNA pseudouridine synthase A [Candidatus Kinetoplastibacterium blastocrithidii TCC012E]|uniref:tRNA pseudouridine synthase A n=1 Tax=Candidatus Kinetoplastidibacterium blastocrithidiae TCC012E TaxID=1208922 RepID=M1LVS5_9PROT|nr:tRNA pseudouridine(38-40) synthase TruA [Candidatus Kinetoplastibacterium blastocrithidii]AFZ83538.1 tRNA pseudouridine synthase A [Candidatus Kinetoplastibacterium blastocrithidii (ex Strigomonas culicis)]AGF49657.1 tRNA pseudouridine synthase A [Candidatus Kinetoplastibacterium blastocrithidii TCC012E]
MYRIAMGISYNGSGFCGWQTQSNLCSIQDVIENALYNFSGFKKIKVVCAGRTDAGVHAVNQVIHFDTNLDRKMESWVRGVNSFLPNSVSVVWSQLVDNDFHARFSAISRTYSYIIYCSKVRSAIYNDLVGWSFYVLDIDLMRRAIDLLVGEHDFSSFRSSQCQSKTPIRTVYSVSLNNYGPFIVFTINANAFLQHMIRNIVGSLIYIGRRNRDPIWIKELLLAKDRTKGFSTFSPNGLYLMDIEYPSNFHINKKNSNNQIFLNF